MASLLGFGVVLVTFAALAVTGGQEPIAGLAPPIFVAVAGLAALSLMMVDSVVSGFHGGWRAGMRAVMIWFLIYAGLIGAYAYRFELQGVADRMIAEIAPGRPVVTPAGEVVVTRRASGRFTLAGRANGREMRFLFDTGASTVVLTTDSAVAAGFPKASLDYSVPVSTANGRALAAPVILDSLSIGSITERRIRALVAQPGALSENLLGMTFLDRLASSEVRGNRLILRGRTTAPPA